MKAESVSINTSLSQILSDCNIMNKNFKVLMYKVFVLKLNL